MLFRSPEFEDPGQPCLSCKVRNEKNELFRKTLYDGEKVCMELCGVLRQGGCGGESS